jgi:uncharacterized protein involved in exopolysaccharide biosynthesis
MPEPFDAYQYASHLGRNWRTIAITGGVACGLSLAVSLLLPGRYTATCRILIEPPAASDQRAAQAVSPIYLESLKTYEHFAASDSLFLNALNRFHLRDESRGKSVERWKRSVLEVEIPRNTRILEIRVTLPDPRQAQALALYLGQETVNLNRTANRAGDEELLRDIQKQFDEAKVRLEQAEAARHQVMVREPTEGLPAQIESLETLRSNVLRDLLAAEELIAEDTEREQRLANDRTSSRGTELEAIRRELPSTRARAEALRRKHAELDRDIAGLQKLLAERTARRDRFLVERKNAQANFEALDHRLREARGTVGFRGERLSIIDPGIVPERPSFPNTPLNVILAGLLGLVGSLLYLSLAFSSERQRATSARPALGGSSQGRED